MARQAGRAGQQYLESSFIVLCLVVVLEWVRPVLAHQAMDWGEFGFSCVFGVLVILAHVAVAYLRPPTRAETVAIVEEILYLEQQRQTAPGMPQVHHPITQPYAPWTTAADTWAPTEPGLPAMPRPTRRPPQ